MNVHGKHDGTATLSFEHANESKASPFKCAELEKNYISYDCLIFILYRFFELSIDYTYFYFYIL